jgi:phenylacetate-coenzyme A ligase PaaK-like adenylate-forming protein
VGDQPGRWSVVLDLWRAQREGEAGLARRRESRFADLLSHARRGSRFYRRLYRDLPAEGAALRDLPPINKRELMAAFDEWVTDPGVTLAGAEAFISDPARIAAPFREKYFLCTSAGTTGQPALFVHDRGAIDVYRAINFARLGVAWFDAGDLWRMALRGYRWAAVLGAGGHYAGAGWIELERRRDPFRSLAYRVFPVQQPLADLVAALNAFDPAVLTGYPSALELLAEEQVAGRLNLRPALVECAGESTTQDAGARMAEAFGCTVRNFYGASECVVMAFSCDRDWLHVNSDWAILEPVDEDFRPVPAGEPSHSVLLTNLANRVQPIVRYDLGDSVLVRPDPCPCGNPLPAIRVAGRRDDVLRLEAADGRTVKILPLAIGSVVDETPGVHRSQLVQTGPAAIRLRLDLKPGADGEEAWRNAIASLSAYLREQGLANVGLVRASEPPEQKARFGKFRQVIAVPPA